jgi:phage minor structural protein
MSEIYVYDKSCDDFTNFGLCGALTPTSCIFEEEANGMSEITLEHPIDDFGRFNALTYDNLLVAEVPVRTTPEIDGHTIVTTVEKCTVKMGGITKAYRTIYRYVKNDIGKKGFRVLPYGAAVTVVQKLNDNWRKVKCDYGTGYMHVDGLDFGSEVIIEDKSQSIESVQPAWTVKPQIFRIYSVEKGIDSIKVSARHISYDLLYNITSFSSNDAVPCYTALAGIMGNCIAEHEFDAYTNLADTRVGLEWTRVNPINALLDPEEGLTALYGAALVRDNWELYVLHDPGMNRGVTIEYAKNMTGLECTESTEDVVTRVIPVGEDKDGNDLLLSGTIYIDSPHINDYPVPHIQVLKCTDCKAASKKAADIAVVREKMKLQAQAVFDEGADVPEVEMSVDFVTLGDTAEYAQYKDLDRLFLWDYVIIRHKKLGLDVTARVASIKWDCIVGRMESMEIGKVGKTLANSGITTWQIPSGFSGNKIATGTVGGNALASDIISTRHVQSESINAEKIQAEAVTAEKINASDISAQAATMTELQAAIAKVTSAYIQNLDSGSITTDDLTAMILKVTGYATIDNLVADSADIAQLITKDATATKVFIKQLQLLSAQMARATVGELVVKASDGNYYKLDVNSSGGITPTQVTLTNAEITAGVTSDGRSSIIETSLTADDLAAGNLKAINALIDHITADRLDVTTLFARDAFVNALYTSTIYGGKSIKIMVGDTAAAAAAASKAQTTADNATTTANSAKSEAESATSAANTAKDTAESASDKAGKAESAVNASVASVVTEYYDSTSATSLVGGSWVTTAPTWQEGHYIWSRTKTTSKDGKTTTYSAEVCITGNTGAQGETGAKGDKGDQGEQGIQGIQGETGAQGAKGETGATGNGISSITYYYARTSSSSMPAASSVTATTMPSLTSTYRYLWQKEVIKYTSGSEQTTVLLLAVYGDTGSKGDKGDKGDQGIQGEQGIQGIQGETGAKGDKGDTGATGAQGEQGVSLVSTTRYYILSASTPTTPTTNPPSGWTTTEPTYTAGSTDDLYFVDLALFSDGSYSYSEVTLSSTYAAARDAKDTADTANSLAQAATSKLQYMEILEDGTHLKAMGTTNEMVLTNEGLHIDVSGEQYSQFGASFAQFGNYQIRRTSDGGLAFKLKL